MELAKTGNKDLAMIEKLESSGLTNDFIAETLKHIATNAVTQNNKGDVIEDFHAKIKVLQLILKIKDKRFDQNNINLNFFQAPPIDQLEY